MTTLINKWPLYKLILFFVFAIIGLVFFIKPASAKGETYAWISDTQVKVKGGNFLDGKAFTTSDWRVTDDAAKGKRAIYNGRLIYTSGNCTMYLALEFTNKDGTLANLVRANSLADTAGDSGECERSGSTYLDLSGANLKITTTNIPVERPATLARGTTILSAITDSDTNGNTIGGVTIPRGCPGGPAGEKAPGTICPISVDKTKTVTCGFLPQWLCDQASSELPTTDKPLGGIQVVIDYVINIVTGLFVIAVILIIVVSGVQISASAGNPDVIKNAKNHIFNAIVGLALLISARAILSVFGIYDTGFAPPVTLFSKISRSNLSLDDFQQILLNGIAIATFISGMVSIIFLIVGGIRYTISAGRPEAMKGAKNTVLYALVGLVISIMAYGIVTFVVDSLT